MSVAPPCPSLQEWYRAQRQWPDQPAAPVSVTIAPSHVRAASPCVVSLRAAATSHIPESARLYFELPTGWGKYLGRGAHGDGSFSGLTAVISPELTRDAVWQALHHRRCYAVFPERILLNFTVASATMGQEQAVPQSSELHSRRPIAARVASATPLTALEVVRNGNVIYAADLAAGQRVAEFSILDSDSLDAILLQPHFEGLRPFCYYLRAITEAGGRAWSSSIWFSVPPR